REPLPVPGQVGGKGGAIYSQSQFSRQWQAGGDSGLVDRVSTWVARSEVLRRACSPGKQCTPFGVPQSVPPSRISIAAASRTTRAAAGPEMVRNRRACLAEKGPARAEDKAEIGAEVAAAQA